MDKISPERRSANMRQIRSKDTVPELTVRRFLHQKGLRFRLHRKELPGHPDLVLPAIRTCLFVHGCFWHGCTKCRTGRRKVKSNAAYWRAKIARNRQRDRQNELSLISQGWLVVTVWGCETADQRTLTQVAGRLRRLKPPSSAVKQMKRIEAAASSRSPDNGGRLEHHRAASAGSSRRVWSARHA